ncbi:predicted protein [Uncinocarpus reesii 1704]|uniref:Uncharacterized protein n=1 Tax=Uncinocarpus reesii (strain UAMH 1704) TaxID=336963 RepID=C4JJN6_UNCRE|nr:uncharacterized protein UREG_01843 [Uncinocarpus reesii 1704]EEP76994.1 predicted protein [Uncinocarpus reesii 1704]
MSPPKSAAGALTTRYPNRHVGQQKVKSVEKLAPTRRGTELPQMVGAESPISAAHSPKPWFGDGAGSAKRTPDFQCDGMGAISVEIVHILRGRKGALAEGTIKASLPIDI